MKSFLALNLQVAEASVAAMHDMPIVAAAKAIASRQAIIFSFDVCIGLAGPPLSCRVWTSADAGNHSTKLRRRWFGAPTVVLRENRRSRSLMTVRRLTAQCLPPLRNKRNSTGDCHAAEFQTGRCRRWVINGPGSPEIRLPLFPRKRTSRNAVGMSVSCQKRTHAPHIQRAEMRPQANEAGCLSG